MKTCPDCNQEKEDNCFYKGRKACKTCIRKNRIPKSNLPNPELSRKLNRLWN